MKNRKLIVGAWVCTMSVLFSGCSLAVPDIGGDTVNKDQFIGVFITTEDLYDLEDRVYATIDKNNSIEPADWDIYFEGLEGDNFFNATFQLEDSEPFNMSVLSGGTICDVSTHYNTSDDGSASVELSGTLYVLLSDNREDNIYYMNPVYQTQSGDIYVTYGDIGDSLGGLSEGVTITSSMNEKYTTTENGKSVTEEMTVNVNFKMGYEPHEILIHHMSADNQLLKTDTYTPGTLPQKLVADKEAAYIIVETKMEDSASNCLREIYEPQPGENTYFETFLITENGRLSKQGTELVWE